MMRNSLIVTWILCALVKEGLITEVVSKRTASDFMRLQGEVWLSSEEQGSIQEAA